MKSDGNAFHPPHTQTQFDVCVQFLSVHVAFLGRGGGLRNRLSSRVQALGSNLTELVLLFLKGGDEEENDEPPKVVVTEVKEEDAFYSKK